MQSPRLPPTAQLKNVSNTMMVSPMKVKGKTSIPLAAPKTPTKMTEGFITSSPASGKRSVPEKQRLKIRAPRTPSGTLFSPTYPPAIGVNQFHQHEPATPTSALSPLQKSLHENIARYGHLAQEFDEYDCDDFDPYRFIASLPGLVPSADVCLPPKSFSAPPITLVLDLDETLVHCSTDAGEVRNPDFIFHVEFQSSLYTVNCRKRPGLDEFLEYVKNRFEVVVFTGVFCSFYDRQVGYLILGFSI